MASRSRSRSRNGRGADHVEAEVSETTLAIRLLSGAVKETTCPSGFSAAQLLEHVTEFFGTPDTDVLLRHAGTAVDAASSNVETLAGGAERLELEAVLQWRFAEAASANPRDVLVEAAGWGHADSVRRLLVLDADPGAVATAGLLRRRGLDPAVFAEYTALHMAVSQGKVDTVDVLLDARAPLDARAAWMGRPRATPLHIAALKGHRNIAALLVARGAAVDAAGPNGAGATPLHAAAVEGHTTVAMLLLERGAAMDAPGEAGHTPLHFAAYQGHREVAALLVARGAAVGATEQDGATPLHIVAKKGHIAVATVLAPHGAAVGATMQGGSTPLHIAAMAGHDAVAAVLVARGAAVDVAAQDGRTPLHVAAFAGHREVAALLVARGATVGAVDQGGAAAWQIAAKRGHVAVADLLLGRP